MAPLITGGSLIQSTFGAGPPHNLEAVVGRRLPDGAYDIQHYWLSLRQPDAEWQRGATISSVASGPASLCQRPGPGNGNFEAAVLEGGGVAHYWLDNSVSGPRPWHRVPGFAAPGADGPGAVVANRQNGNLELVAQHGRHVVHHWFDRTAWRRGPTISTKASGAPSLIHSDYDHLEVLVLEDDHLILYWFDGTNWRDGGIATLAGDGPASLVQGGYGAAPHFNFELAVPRGDALVTYWRDNQRSPDLPWRPAGLATWGAGPVHAVSLCSADYGNGRTWLHALSQEGTSIYHLYRPHLGANNLRWTRTKCIRLDDQAGVDVDTARPRSRRVAQVTGDRDLQAGGPTLSQSLSTSGVRGTDLGVSVHHRNRHLLLFGDTHWNDPARITLDSIAEVMPFGIPPPTVRLHGSPLRIVGGGTTDREYDVPLDGFSLLGQLFVFFSSNHFDHGQVMGRSVLARAIDPNVPIDPKARDRTLDFQFLTTFSNWRFVNTTVQLVPAASVAGFGRAGHVLLIWGSGGYRADDLRLAAMELQDPVVFSLLLDHAEFPVHMLGTRYFAGMCGASPLWSARESDARPVLWPCALGELSVRWVPELERYLLLAMTGPEDPLGAAVWLRVSRFPWGPWSRRRQVFDWVADGMGLRDVNLDGAPDRERQFIHDANAVPPDNVGDCIFPHQCASGGGAYAPYLFGVSGQGETVTLHFTLSTWNPYQVMMMEHTVTLPEVAELEHP
ncbi:MAG: DUF4185 domain-containing protein [Vicinamibacterales bacterium]